MSFKALKFSTLLFWAVTASIFISCSPEDEQPQPIGEPGHLSVALADISVEEIDNNSGRVEDFAPVLTLEDFGMIIYQKGTTNIIRQFAVGQIPISEIELMDGEYTAVLDNEMSSDLTVGHYTGSQDFLIEPQQLTNIDVAVSLQEVYVTFTLLENFYTTHRITVEDANGQVVSLDTEGQYPELYLPLLAAPDEYSFAVVNKTSSSTIGTVQIVSDIAGKGYNLSVVPLAGSGVFTVSINPIVVEDDDFILVPTVINGFNDDFAAANWTASNNSSATAYNFSSTDLSFDCPGGGGGFTAQITIPADGTLTFDWSMSIRTAGQYGDRISYILNGTTTNLTTAGGGSGSVNIAVSQGDTFTFSTWGTTQSSSYYGSISNFLFAY